MSNFLGFVTSQKGRDMFFPDEDEMLTYLKDLCDEEVLTTREKLNE